MIVASLTVPSMKKIYTGGPFLKYIPKIYAKKEIYFFVIFGLKKGSFLAEKNQLAQMIASWRLTFLAGKYRASQKIAA